MLEVSEDESASVESEWSIHKKYNINFRLSRLLFEVHLIISLLLFRTLRWRAEQSWSYQWLPLSEVHCSSSLESITPLPYQVAPIFRLRILLSSARLKPTFCRSPNFLVAICSWFAIASLQSISITSCISITTSISSAGLICTFFINRSRWTHEISSI